MVNLTGTRPKTGRGYTRVFHFLSRVVVALRGHRNGLTSLAPQELKRLSASSLFDLNYYRLNNPDLKSFDDGSVKTHYLKFGRWEGRVPLPKQSLFAALGTADCAIDEESKARPQLTRGVTAGRMLPSRDFILFVHSEANWQIKVQADALATVLEEIGKFVRIADESSESDYPSAVKIIVAPHEFWPRGVPARFHCHDFIAQCILYQTEQVGSRWFDLVIPYLYIARGLIDVSPQTAMLLKNTLPTTSVVLPIDGPVRERLGIGYSQPLKKLENRPLDFCFLGAVSPFRDYVLDALAEVIPDLTFHLEYAHDQGIISDHKQEAQRQVVIGSESRVHLAIARHPSGFFTWDRMIMSGLGAGALPLSTPVRTVGGLQQGEHYIAVAAPQLPATLLYLLRNPQGRKMARDVSARGIDLVRSDNLRKTSTHQIMEFLVGIGLVGSQ